MPRSTLWQRVRRIWGAAGITLTVSLALWSLDAVVATLRLAAERVLA